MKEKKDNFKIEEGIPSPLRGGLAKKIAMIVGKMKVGDSILVTSNNDVAYANTAAKARGLLVISRKENDVSRRVWLIDPKK